MCGMGLTRISNTRAVFYNDCPKYSSERRMYASTFGVVLANIRATKWKFINVILITRIYRIFLCSDWIGLDKREISLSRDRITVSVCSSPESMLKVTDGAP